MELHNFSQLPVINRANRKPTGVVTWETIGRALISDSSATLKDCIDDSPPKYPLDHDLLRAIDAISEHGYALVTKRNGTLSGIVTSADLGAALAMIAGPFLLLERLEDRLGHALEQLRRQGHTLVLRAKDDQPASAPGHVDEVRNLTLGEKIDLFTKRETWEHVTQEYDRAAVAGNLGDVVNLRNQLMHFRELNKSQQQALGSLPYVVDTISQISKRVPTQG